MTKIDEKRFHTESKGKYRNEVLGMLDGLCRKGIAFGLNDEENELRKEINKISDKYYFGR